MQKSTLVTACMAMAVLGAQAAPDSREARVEKLPKFFKTAMQADRHNTTANASQAGAHSQSKANKAFSIKAAEAAQQWRAATQRAYGWNGEEWELEETYNIGYDDNGQPIVRNISDVYGGVVREAMTYNSNGMLATRFTEVAEEEEEPFEPSERLSREYDSRVTDFITLNHQELWTGEAWVPSNYYSQTITRNDDGNVTLMERAVYFQGELDPTYRLIIGYGEDGKANRIEESELTYDYGSGELVWQTVEVITDIVWNRTDGQIVSAEESLFSDSNRISSCKVLDEDEMEWTVNVEYSEEGGSEIHLLTYDPEEDEDIDVWRVYTPLDDNGSCKIETTANYIYDGFPYYTDVVTETYVYDAYGLILLEEITSNDGLITWIEERIEGEVEYDDNFGYPLKWTLSEYDPDEYELYPMFMAEYSDYVGVTGIDKVTDADTEAVYYDLQGRKVANPASGLYIRRSGSKAEKVIIR